MKAALPCFLGLLLLSSCTPQPRATALSSLLADAPSITGKPEYLDSPYLTPGNRAYLVGHQNGTFPDLGWHVKGEMGGLWDHPIKLMDGFDFALTYADSTVDSLNDGIRFKNFPFTNQLVFDRGERGIRVERWQFVPDDAEGLVVQLVIDNDGDATYTADLALTGHSDLRPTWLGERTGMVDGTDVANYDETTGSWTVKDADNPWHLRFGADRQPSGYQQITSERQGQGSSARLLFPLTIAPRGRAVITFAFAGSYHSEAAAETTYQHLLANYVSDFTAKRDRYADLGQRSKLTVPDTALQRAWEWLKYNGDWLVQTVPEIGTGITAGIPDYPWWFGCDSEYALRGYLAAGQTDAVFSTIALLDSVSRVTNGNGRIVHEISSNGAVYNKGNINETPQFASLIWEVYRWTGEAAFLRKYWPTVRAGMEWLLAENDADGNGFPDGAGMMEINGLESEMIDVATYTYQGCADAGAIARQVGATEWADRYTAIAATLKERINADFWSEDFGSYADFRSTDEDALRLIADAIVRADTLDKPWAVAELQATAASIRARPRVGVRPFVVHHNWVVNTPLEVGLADTARALRALETAERFVNPFGVFVTGIDRDASAGNDDGSFAGSQQFSYTGAVMTLPTGVQAIAENNYGRPDQALDYLQRMTRSFSFALPGSMYEVSPDYGMITQAWNLYAFGYPLVQQFFGIQPFAAERRIVVRPRMPSAWPSASLENVRVGDNVISVYYARDAETPIRVEQAGDWEIVLE